MAQPDIIRAMQNPEIILETRAFGSHLIQIGYGDLINCYLVRDKDGFILIDTLIETWTAALAHGIRQYRLPITHILLTHAHHDHVGGIDGLHAAWPAAEIAISAREARLLAGDQSLDAGEPPDPVRGAFPRCASAPTRLLRDGDSVGPLRVVAAPGHTPGQVAFFDSRDGTLIAGDAFQTLDGGVVSGTEVPTLPHPARATWSRRLAMQSAERLRALAPTRLAVGHGPVIDQPQALMDRAITRAMQEGVGLEPVAR